MSNITIYKTKNGVSLNLSSTTPHACFNVVADPIQCLEPVSIQTKIDLQQAKSNLNIKHKNAKFKRYRTTKLGSFCVDPILKLRQTALTNGKQIKGNKTKQKQGKKR